MMGGGVSPPRSKLARAGCFVILSLLLWLLCFSRPTPSSWEQGKEEEEKRGTDGAAGGRATTDRATAQRHCQQMFSVDTGGQLWADDGHYAQLSRQLPPLLRGWSANSTDATGSVATVSRLTILEGSVPYIPCKIRLLDASDVGSCTAARSAHGLKTWVAFVGDSNGRQKMHSFLYSLPDDLEYSFFLGYRQVTRENFLVAVANHEHRPMTFDIVGHRRSQGSGGTEGYSPGERVSNDQDVFSLFEPPKNATKFPFSLFPLREESVPSGYELRVTLVWAPLASEVNSPLSKFKMKVSKLKEWVDLQVVPDVIVLGFGKWMLIMREEMEELIPFTEATIQVRPLVALLKQLAAKTTVLWWHQSRYRGFNFEYGLQLNRTNHDKFWKHKLRMMSFQDGIPFMDAWIWKTTLRDTGIWHWDSTVPFSVANVRDCHTLMKSGVGENKMYKGRWWNCGDVHHSAYETNEIEIQMLFNFLCNPFITRSPDTHCCSHR